MAKKSFFKQSANVLSNSTTTVIEITKPVKFVKNEVIKSTLETRPAEWGKWFFTLGLTLVICFIGVVAISAWWYANQFQSSSRVKLSEIVSNYFRNDGLELVNQNQKTTILLLGVDQSLNQRETSLLTDTMILIQFDKTKKTFSLYSLPRDLWIDSLKTKINALYYYGQQDGNDGGITLVKSVVSEISGLPVDYYVVINMDSLRQIIDALGGIEVEVKRAFVDEQYPREIDLSSTDPSILYETIKFEAGKEKMSGDRALKYIRSRHSRDEFEGSDEGREQRQQQLLTALKTKLTAPETIANPQVMGQLYRVWKDMFISNIGDTALLSFAKSVGLTTPLFNSKTMPVQDATNSGIIFHPQKGPANQWVYLPTDPSWTEIRKWFHQ